MMSDGENLTNEHRCGLALATMKNLVLHGPLEPYDDTLRLVHALVEEDGEEFVTGWVECGDSVYMGTLQSIGGQPVVLKYIRDGFAADGRIKARKSYTAEEALAEVAFHGTFGPWDPAYTKLPDNVVPIKPGVLN